MAWPDDFPDPVAPIQQDIRDNPTQPGESLDAFDSRAEREGLTAAARQIREQNAADKQQVQVVKAQRIKAKDYFGKAGIPTVDDGTTIAPVTDEAGQPLTHHDRTNDYGWDSLGAPRQIERQSDGTATLRDPYENAPTATDERGNTYAAPKGLAWKDIGLINPEVATRYQDKVDAQASTILNAQVTNEQQELARAAKDLRARTKALTGAIPSLAEAPDDETGRKAIDDHFNEEYADPKANYKVGWFNTGDYSDETKALRSGIDQRKAQAHAEFDGIVTRRDALESAKQAADARSQQAREMENRVLATRLAKARANGADIPPIAGIDDLGAAATPSTPTVEAKTPDGQTATLAAFDPKGQAFQASDAGEVAFDPTRLNLGVTQAYKAGALTKEQYDTLKPKALAAEKALAEQAAMLANDTVASKLKALGVGAGKGAAFLAGAPAGAGVGAEIGSFFGPVGTAVGGTLGGLVSGSIASWGADKIIKKLAEHSETVKGFTDAAAAHPYYDAAGNLIAFGSGLPKAGMKAVAAGIRAVAPAGEGVLARGAEAVAKGYEASGGGVVDTVKNLAEDASIRTASGASAATVAKALTARVGGAAAANVAIDTILKEGSKALGFSDEGQTLNGAAQAALIGAFVSGHGLKFGDATPEQVASAAVKARLGTPMSQGEEELATAFNAAITKMRAEGKIPQQPTADEMTELAKAATGRQATSSGKHYGVTAVKVENPPGLTAGQTSRPSLLGGRSEEPASREPETSTPSPSDRRSSAIPSSDQSSASAQIGPPLSPEIAPSLQNQGQAQEARTLSPLETLASDSRGASQASVVDSLLPRQQSNGTSSFPVGTPPVASGQVAKKDEQPAEPALSTPSVDATGQAAQPLSTTEPAAAPAREPAEVAPEIELAARERELAAIDPKAPPFHRSLIEGRIRELRDVIAQQSSHLAETPPEPPPTQPLTTDVTPSPVHSNPSAQPVASSAPPAKTWSEYYKQQYDENTERQLPADYFGEWDASSHPQRSELQLVSKRNGFDILKSNQDILYAFDGETPIGFDDLTAIHVAPDRQGNGVGSALLDEGMKLKPDRRLGSHTIAGANLWLSRFRKSQSSVTQPASVEPRQSDEPVAVAKGQAADAAQPVEARAGDAEISQREWGDVAFNEKGASSEVKDGRTGKIHQVTQKSVVIRPAEGKPFVVPRGSVRVTGPATAPTAENTALGAAPAVSKEAEAAHKLASAVLKTHSAELQTLGHPIEIQTGETPNKSGIYTNSEGRIIIDPAKVHEDTKSLSPQDRLQKIKRAVAEEVLHVATIRYASENSDNFAKVQALAHDAEWAERGREAYGPEWDGLNDFQKGAEIARMLLQGKKGKLTEAAYRYLAEFMKWLRKKLRNLSPQVREVLSEIEARMGKFREESKAPKVAAPAEEGWGGIADNENGAFVETRKGRRGTVQQISKSALVIKGEDGKKFGAKRADARVIPAPEKAPRKRTFAVANTGDTFRDNPIIQAILEHGGLMSKTTAKAEWDAEKWSENQGEWDDAPTKFAHPTHNQIYKPDGLQPNEMAGVLRDAGLLPESANENEMWAAIREVSVAGGSTRKQVAAQVRDEQNIKEQYSAFAEDSQSKKSGDPIPVNDLSIGDKVKVADREMRVINVDEDGFVTLEDGTKYGIQTVQDGQTIYGEVTKGEPAGDEWMANEVDPIEADAKLDTVEKAQAYADKHYSIEAVEPVASSAPENAQGGQAEHGGQGGAGQAESGGKEAVGPKLREGEKGTGDLLQGEDAPFNLAGEKGIDHEARAKEKADAEAKAKAAKEKADREQQQLFAGKAPTAGRFKPRERVNFTKPFEGPSGAKLAAYEWQWQPEEYIDKRGEDRVRRVSDWEKAEASAESGRDIVHHFHVEMPDGETRIVSAESVPALLGFTDRAQQGRLPSIVSATKTLAKQRMKLAITEAQHAENERILEEVSKLSVPEISGPEKAYPDSPTSTFNRFVIPGTSAWQGQHEPGPATNSTRDSLVTQWRDIQASQRGYQRINVSVRDLKKQIAKQEAKLETLTAKTDESLSAASTPARLDTDPARRLRALNLLASKRPLRAEEKAELAKLEQATTPESNHPVRVTFDDGTSYVDAVKGSNEEHAMERARRNWPSATKVEPATQEDLQKELKESGITGLFAAATPEAEKSLAGKVWDRLKDPLNRGKLTPEDIDAIGPVLRFGAKDFYQGMADKLKALPGTHALGVASEGAKDLWREIIGQAQMPFRTLKQKIGSKAFDAAAEQVKTYRAQVDSHPGERQMLEARLSADAKTMASAQDDILNRFGTMAERMGVQVQDDAGNWRPFTKRNNYFPRIINRRFLNALENPAANPKDFREAVQIFVKWSKEGRGNEAIPILDSAADVLKYTAKAFREGRGNDHNGNIEHARTIPLPNRLYDYSFEAFAKYVNNAARRLAQIKHFGQKTTLESKDLWEKTIDTMSDVPSREYVARGRDITYGVRSRDAATRTMAFLNSVATGTQLTNPVTTIANLIGGITDNIHMYGLANTAKGILEMRKLSAVINDAYAKGLLHEDMMDMAHDSEQHGSNLVEKTSELAAKGLRLAGYNMVEEFNRGLSLVAGKAFLRAGIKAHGSNPDSRAAREFVSHLQKTGVDTEKVIAENGEGRESDRYLRRSANESQGGYGEDQTPQFINTPLGQFLLKYQKWGTQHTRFFMRRAVDPAMEFIKTKGKSGSMVPLFRYVLLTAVAGLGLTALKSALFGSADPSASLEEIQRTATEDQKRAFVLLAQKIWKAQMAVSAGGIVSNYAQMAADVADRSRFKNPLTPPGTSMAIGTGEQLFRLIEQKKLTLSDLDDFMRGQLSAYRTLKAGAARAADAGGVPVLANERARQDSSWLGAMTRRFADEVGVEASRTSMGRIGKTEMSPVKQELLDALRTGDTAAARQAFKEFIDATPKEQRGPALTSIKATVQASQPVRVGTAGEARREIFLSWAQRRLPPEDIARLKQIDARYRNTAAKLGLLNTAPASPQSMAATLTKMNLTSPNSVRPASPRVSDWWKARE